MKKDLVTRLHNQFESVIHKSGDIEFWYGRDLQELLGYSEWRNFVLVINKAKEACANSKQKIRNHFVDVNKMVPLGSGSLREVEDIKLTRYACYLIAQNGDPRKTEIAFAQTYFAIQTRKQEMIEKRLAEMERLQAREKLSLSEKQVSGVLFERGIDNRGFARIKSKGDKALFGGNTTQQMKAVLGVPDSRPLADFLPTITIKAKDFANEITAFNTVRDNLQNETTITSEHVKNNEGVRSVLIERKIYPENLPPAEDIKKVERKINAENKKIPNIIKSLKD